MSTYTIQEFERWIDRQSKLNGGCKMELYASVESIEYLITLYGNIEILLQRLKSKSVKLSASSLKEYNKKHSKKLKRK